MGVLSRVSALALGPLVSGACRAAGVSAVGDGLAAVARFLSDRVSDDSRRAADALADAADRAWRTLELALAGDGPAAALDRAEDRAFREEVRRFLLAAQFDGRAAADPGLVPRCLGELRAARAAGLLAGDGEPVRAGDLSRFADPAGLVAAEWAVADELAADLRAAGYPTLAGFLALRPAGDPGAAPLLAVAVRHHFRRAVGGDERLFRGLAFAQLERIGTAQADGAARLARIEGLLGGVLAALADRERTPPPLARELPPTGPSAVSPDGRTAVCGSPYDGKVRVLDAVTGKELRRLPGHPDWVTCLALAPDGRRVASGGRDGTVKVWDAATGRLVRTFPFAAPVDVAFAADGRAVTATAADGVARTWRVG